MNSKQLERWNNIRSKGQLRYVLLHGVVAFGLVIFFLSINSNPQLSPIDIAIRLVFCCVGGYAFGSVMWFVQEIRFKGNNE